MRRFLAYLASLAIAITLLAFAPKEIVAIAAAVLIPGFAIAGLALTPRPKSERFFPRSRRLSRK